VPRFDAISLAHRHYETFDLEWHELGDESNLFPLMFGSDPDGDITSLTVPFEPTAPPQQFERLADARAEFELDESGAVSRLVAQPLGIFLPKR
jgi:hypothetical protein